MTDWKFRVDLALEGLLGAEEEGQISRPDLARAMAKNIRENLIGHASFETVNVDGESEEKLDDLADELEALADSNCRIDIEDIDGVLEDLYDWADASGVWIEPF